MGYRWSCGSLLVASSFRSTRLSRITRIAGLVLSLAALTLGIVCLTPRSPARSSTRPTGHAARTPAPTAAACGPTFTIIDAAGAGTGLLQGTIGVNVNAQGDLVGTFLTAPNIAHGFVRTAASGTIAEFNSPHAGTNLNQGTFALGIDAAGDAAGMYADSSNAYHGFVRSAAGTITEFDVPA